MKNFLLLCTSALFIFLLTAFVAQDKTEIATLRTYEIAGMWKSKIIISYPDGSGEEIDLEKMTQESMQPNSTKITEALNMMIAKGYKLVSAAGGVAESTLSTTYVFER